MPGLLQQVLLSIRLNFRNRMALIYGYLFPAIFLLAFRTLYRFDQVPLIQHIGELLTVTILGGACFGLPTGIVSDRERGVWRRYKTLPVSPLSILAGTLVTRYLLLLTAGMLQLGLAMAIGMPVPTHPFALWAAFSAAAVAFIGIGLDIAMLAPNVPAVQALGQCIFLPMLIIGGVGVPLANLPAWAQHVAAFLPGRYAVELIQSCISGDASATHADALLLLTIGAAGALAGILAFRWDSRQRASPWVALALAGWLIAGFSAESRGVIRKETVQREEEHKLTEYVPPVKGEAAWEDVTAKDFAGVAFDRLPDDTGIIAPIAIAGQEAEPAVSSQLDALDHALPQWPPAKEPDPVQRIRNYLMIPAVLDVYRMDPLERFVPLVILDHIQDSVPGTDLHKVLYYIATHPQEGSDTAARELHRLGLPDAPDDTRKVRNRVMLYAFKMLGRLIVPQHRK